MPTPPIQRGTVVYDVADPRHHGIVRSLHLHNGKFCANVQWIENGWHESRVPVADLRRVTDETPGQPVRGRRLSKPEYGRHNGHPVRYTHDEAWMLVDGAWREHEPVFVRRLTRQAYRETFGRVPPLPRDAFSSDPSRWPIRYGCYDGFAYRFRDCEVWGCFNGQWRKESPTELVYNVGVLKEADYMSMYGPGARWPVPPLPDAAFRSGWRSPLV